MVTKLFLRNIVAVMVFSTLVGCQTIGSTQGQSSQSPNNYQVSLDSYSIFFDQTDHLKDLIEAEDWDSAAILYEEQQDHFLQLIEKHQELLSTLSYNLNQKHAPAIQQADKSLQKQEWPTPESNWAQVQSAISSTENVIDDYGKIKLLQQTEFESSEIVELRESLSKLKREITDSANENFLSFSHSGSNFFQSYPVKVDTASVLNATFPNLLDTLRTKSSDGILAFAGVYSLDTLGEENWTALSNAFVEKRLEEQSDSGDLQSMLRTLKDASQTNLTPNALGNFRFGFIEITSRTLLNKGQIEFPAQIELDLPVEIHKAELDEALDSPLAGSSEYLIIFDIALAKTARKLTGAKKKASKALVGYKSVPNPDYNMAQNLLNQAQMDLQTANMNIMQANSQYCYGLGCLGKAISQTVAAAGADEAQQNIAAAMERLNSTPMEIDQPVYAKYNWDLTRVKSTKVMTAHYYVVDRKKGTYFKSTFDIVENEEFDVAYNVNADDPNRSKIVQQEDTEQDVVEWEESGSTILLTQLIEHYLANIGDSKKLPSMSVLRKEMLSDRNKALAAYADETFTASTQNDPRFDSVVAILMPDGALGSGFYVAPDIVMTNYHVVEEGDFAELQLYGGLETFGKVIARDLRLDLALIKVQARGKPVKFHDKNTIELGKTVEVIGHPKGYRFSITRGIVSAVREMPSIVVRTSKDVLQVQIDAPTSQGNSGGPVFMGNKVVSIVSWGRIDRGSQNLNFTIHHSEAQRFLNESLSPNS